MPVYKYKALGEEGKEKVGMIEGDTPRDARNKLRVASYHVTDLKEVKPEEMNKKSIQIPLFKGNLLLEVTSFTRQFSTLLKAGIPLDEALQALIRQTTHSQMQAILRDVRERVRQGDSIGDAFAAHPSAFSDLYINMVKAGEASGNLSVILDRIGDYYKKQNQVRGKISAALAYPIIMIIIGTGVVIFLMTVVVPKIVKVITKRGGALPMPTEVLIGVSSFLQHFWWLLIILFMGASFGFKLFLRNERGRFLFDAFLLKVPLLGDLFKKQAISRFAITFSTLLQSGVPALEALAIVKNIVGNKVLEKALADASQSIKEGKDISASLEKGNIFPPVVQCMIATGEESGHLEEILEKLAESYDEEIDLTTQKLTSLVEPVIIVCLAVVVGFIVMAVVLPMVQGFQMG